jgi:hypothetical protein
MTQRKTEAATDNPAAGTTIHSIAKLSSAKAGCSRMKYLCCGFLSAILMELSQERNVPPGWETGKRYLNMDVKNEKAALEQQEIYRKNVA